MLVAKCFMAATASSFWGQHSLDFINALIKVKLAA